jgi:PAT family beta-lactamase induction signal transducer AmpG
VTLRETLAALRRPRVWLMVLMGFASGLPLLLSGSTLSAWLTDAKFDLATIGFLTWARTAYTWKVLWSPLLDRYPPPLLGGLGQRRGWIVWMQLGVTALLATMAVVGPSLPMITVLVLALAVTAASQDIVVDAWRTDLLAQDERPLGVAIFTMGYRIGLLVAGMLALVLSDAVGWSTTYLIMAACMAACVVVTLMAPEPDVSGRPTTLGAAVVEPLREFFGRGHGLRAALGVLLFLTLFRVGDVLAATMNMPFLKALGFTNTEIGVLGKVITFFGSVLGGLIGGGFVLYLGLFRSLVIFGIAQAATNVAYVALALTGKSMPVLVGGMIVDQVAGGLASTAIGVLIMGLCAQRFSAVQFALLTSASGLLGHLVAGFSGVWAASVGWATFFGLTMAAVIPALLLLWPLRPLVEAAEREQRG